MTKKGLFKKIDFYLLSVLLIAFLILPFYAFLAVKIPTSWTDENKIVLNSPDETANLYFAHLFKEETRLYFIDSANQTAEGLVAPRSMRVIDGRTVPAGFIGLPIIYGTMAKVLTTASIPYYTPALALIGILFFYLFVKKLFNKRTAFFSSLLLIIIPPLWYYSLKGLMPNVPFFSLLMAGLYFMLTAFKSGRWPYYILSGLFLGLALMIRPSEIFWIVFICLALMLSHIKKVKWQYLPILILMLVLVFSPIFYFNYQIYGSPLSIGYETGASGTEGDLLTAGVNFFKTVFLPFGFSPRLALNNLLNYTYHLFPVWSIFIAFSSILFIYSLLQRKYRLTKFLLLIVFLGLSFYLAIYYGSWKFHDNPDPTAVTIGTSYVRYWLPIYAFSLIFAGYIFGFYYKRYKLVTLVIFTLLWAGLFMESYKLVYLEKDEGIFKVAVNLEEYQTMAKKTSELTEENAIIISHSLDKAFFPARRVIYELLSPKDYKIVKKLIENGYPVYYFYFTRQGADLEYFSHKFYGPYNLQLESSIIDFENQSLYPVKLKQPAIDNISI